MKENNKDGYVCQRCARVSPTCCRLGSARSGLGGGDCFPLSRHEHGRIEEALSQARGKRLDAGAVLLLKRIDDAVDSLTGRAGWCVDEPNSPDFLKAMRDLFPGERDAIRAAFPDGESHMRLALDPDGACVFLSEHGCVLPRPARPYFCRIFPFWVVRGRLQCFQSEDCLAVREQPGNFMALLGAFDSSPVDITERYQMLRLDWGLDA